MHDGLPLPDHSVGVVWALTVTASIGSRTLDSLRVGAFAGVLPSANTYALDYVYSSCNQFGYSDANVDLEIDLNCHRVRLGLGFRF